MPWRPSYDHISFFFFFVEPTSSPSQLFGPHISTTTNSTNTTSSGSTISTIGTASNTRLLALAILLVLPVLLVPLTVETSYG
jgi:hypothetical protein